MKKISHRNEVFRQLERLYEFYLDFIKGFGLACSPGCHTCCTVNVIATSLELQYILDMDGADQRLRNGLEAIKQSKRGYYKPDLTINEEATYYLKGVSPPEGQADHVDSPCPLVDRDGLCTIYDRRPFACRSMLSKIPCHESGHADMDPFIITINLATYQIIEHMAKGGFYGNLWDLVRCFVKGDLEMVHTRECTGVTGFLVAPEEQRRFDAFLRRLQAHTGLKIQ